MYKVQLYLHLWHEYGSKYRHRLGNEVLLASLFEFVNTLPIVATQGLAKLQ
jgi:hypothetical protein